MKAVILAAGKGTRMLPLTLDKPKPLLEVMGKPLIQHHFELLPDEIDEAVVVIGYLGDQIKSFLGEKFVGRKITYVEQKDFNGPFGAVLLTREHLINEDRFFVLFADDLYAKGDFKKLLDYENAVLVDKVEHPERFGIVEEDSAGHIRSVVEKPQEFISDLAMSGAYVFSTRIFDFEPEVHGNGEYYFPPVMLKLMKEQPVKIVKGELWIPIGYPEDLRTAEQILVAREGQIARI